MEDHLTVFTEVGLEDMLNNSRVRGEELAVPRVYQPAGAMPQGIFHMLVKDPVEVLELPEHGPYDRRPVLVSPGKLSDAEDGEGCNNTQDVEGDH
ncbi:hypothetical protein ACP4OV_017168 [Aristida adscensionis]